MLYNIIINKVEEIREVKPMSITKLMNRADELSEINYMWHGRELRENYGATQEMMNEFWEAVDKRVDSNYMKEYEEFHIAHEESCEQDLTYISLCGISVDSFAVQKAIDELEVENVEEWLEVTIKKLEEVIKRVTNDFDKIQGEIITRYNLIYVESEED